MKLSIHRTHSSSIIPRRTLTYTQQTQIQDATHVLIKPVYHCLCTSCVLNIHIINYYLTAYTNVRYHKLTTGISNNTQTEEATPLLEAVYCLCTVHLSIYILHHVMMQMSIYCTTFTIHQYSSITLRHANITNIRLSSKRRPYRC